MDEKVIEENKEHSNESAAIEEAIGGDQKCVNLDGEANKDLTEENKKHTSESAAIKEAIEGDQKCSEAAERKGKIEEDKGDENLKDATENKGTEDSNIGSPQKDGDDEFTSTTAKKLIDEEKEGQDTPPKDAADNEITPAESASVTTSQEQGGTSGGSCEKDDEKEADGGARTEELPVKGILAVKLKAKKKTVRSAIPETRPVNIGVAPKKRQITLNVKEKDSKKKDQADEVFRNPHPVMTTKIWLDSKNENDTKEEPETISSGRELLGDIGGRVQEDIKFTPRKGDQHRSSFRHQQTVGRIAESNEWHLDSDDVRYGVHRTYSDQPPHEEPGAWDIFKVVVMDLCCCCCCGSPPDPYYIEEAKNYVQSHQQEEMGGNGENSPADQNMEDVSLNCNSNMEEAKPKRDGRMKRIRRFFKRLFCCTAGCRDD